MPYPPTEKIVLAALKAMREEPTRLIDVLVWVAILAVFGLVIFCP